MIRGSACTSNLAAHRRIRRAGAGLLVSSYKIKHDAGARYPACDKAACIALLKQTVKRGETFSPDDGKLPYATDPVIAISARAGLGVTAGGAMLLGEKNYKVKVRWQSGACYYREHASDSNEVYQSLHSFFKEKEVVVTDQAGGRAEYMEVHFYPDGEVQVAVTANASAPRLALSEERKDKSRYPRCPNDEQPK